MGPPASSQLSASYVSVTSWQVRRDFRTNGVKTMKRLSILSIFAFVFLGIAVMQAIAQTGNKANNSQGSQGSQSGQGSGSGMPGLSFTPAEWPALKLPRSQE